MQYGTQFATHLPALRRFARAACGQQQTGDDLVVRALERLSKSDITDHNVPATTVLFRLVNDLIGYDRSLSAVARPQRRAFLLTAIEGFDTSQTAAAMRLPQSDIALLLEQAYRDVAATTPTDIMIIEDEFFIAMDLDAIVSELGHRVVGLARTRSEAMDVARQTSPKLILADIQLADGSSGIDAVHDILAGHTCPVIFATAYPERLLTGLRPEPAYLMTKPFYRDTVRATVSQAIWTNARTVAESQDVQHAGA